MKLVLDEQVVLLEMYRIGCIFPQNMNGLGPTAVRSLVERAERITRKRRRITRLLGRLL